MSDFIVACASCGAKNRKTVARLGERPMCGRCGNPLPRGGGPVALTELDFDAALKASPVPVLVDFWAAWCGPCKVFAPVLERFAAAHADEVLVAKVDTEAHPYLASRFGIRSIPTTVLFRGPIEVDRQMGALPEGALQEWVRSRLS